MSDGDHDRPYNPDGYGCGPAVAAAIVAVMALLLVLPGVLWVIA